jgi:hypothetical protein
MTGRLRYVGYLHIGIPRCRGLCAHNRAKALGTVADDLVKSREPGKYTLLIQALCRGVYGVGSRAKGAR